MIEYRALDDSEEKTCSAFFLPLFSGEHDLPDGFRAFLYLIGLLWVFLGIGIVSDTFMCAIEVITSTEKEIMLPGGDASISVKIWNPTIANLSLMALGSSAPEILLNVIEICVTNNFYAGDLGPSTIVGSAAFNLLCIVAVCILGIPEGEGRFIKDNNVFLITAGSSIFAYLWLLIILKASSPNVVQVWEAVLTFIFFPCLLIAAFLADKGYFSEAKVDPIMEEKIVEMNPNGTQSPRRRATAQQVAEFLRRASVQVGNGQEDQMAKLIAAKLLSENKPTRAQLRMNAVRMMVGAKRIVPNKKVQEEADRLFVRREDDKRTSLPPGIEEEALPQMQFDAAAYCVMEGDGYAEIRVTRFPPDLESSVAFQTKKGTATPGDDYEETSGILNFKKGETQQSIKVKVFDDDECEDDETFFVVLSSPVNGVLGDCVSTEVTIIDDDEPGEIGFRPEDAIISVLESKQHVNVPVSRLNGASGQVSCRYRTEDKSAIAGRDYEHCQGILNFTNGEVKKNIQIPINNCRQYEKKTCFKVVLSDIVGPRKDMHFADFKESTINIVNDEQMKKMIDNVTDLLHINLQKFDVGQGTYASQFRDAISVEGDDECGPSTRDYIMHFVSLPWKLLFALIPPTKYYGGWLCFCISLMFIGLVTIFVGDLASLFGCVIGLDDAITAITIVALGTSLPDTFASMAAAKIDDHADAAIGNVTGSNSVNVFLGIGLPWSIAAIFWSVSKPTDKWFALYGGPDGPGTRLDLYSKYPNGVFAVPAGGLGFSVGIFTGCAVCCIALLLLRRKFLGSELGGDTKWKRLSCGFLVFLWFLYVILSSLNSKALI